MPTGELPRKIKSNAPVHLPQFKVVWKKCRKSKIYRYIYNI